MPLLPDWKAPANVRALMTTRLEPSAGGEGADRAGLTRLLGLPSEPVWLKQVHGTVCLPVPAERAEGRGEGLLEADASCTRSPGVVCVAQAADCLPVVFCNDAGTVVAAAHAGWRGLAAGVLEATVAAMGEPAGTLMAWMGPAIGPESFEVGEEVRDAFAAHDRDALQHFRRREVKGKYLADLYGLARQRLARAGVLRANGGGLDTYRDAQRFFSFRREGRTGRQCALVWLDLQGKSVAPRRSART